LISVTEGPTVLGSVVFASFMPCYSWPDITNSASNVEVLAIVN